MRVGTRDVARITDVLDPAWSWLLPRRIDLARVDAILDHSQWQVVLALFAQYAPQQLDVVGVELAIPGRGSLRIDQSLTLEEPDLRDRDVGKLLEQQCEDLADREVSTGRRCRDPGR